jgi:hypothetical protein
MVGNDGYSPQSTRVREANKEFNNAGNGLMKSKGPTNTETTPRRTQKEKSQAVDRRIHHRSGNGGCPRRHQPTRCNGQRTQAREEHTKPSQNSNPEGQNARSGQCRRPQCMHVFLDKAGSTGTYHHSEHACMHAALCRFVHLHSADVAVV